ncbi:MAG: 50S ribosomal protein L10 [Fimbriimonadaceae bacterium]|nr:50S ribosomal protein L10 [Fimbriimonadaceae bacterium]QYK55080.1 MAG: 50S ribosomal protein L10 [Fimbriimonadaceae bacterium]
MPTAQKANVIDMTKARYDKAAGVIFSEYRGLKVHQLQTLRKQLKDKGGEFQVVKNTLFRIAIGDHAKNLPEELGSGPTAVVYLYENETDLAKVLMDFAKTNKALIVKGGLINGKSFNDKQVESLSKLPPRDVLIAQVIGAVAAPLSNLVGVVEALYADPIRVIGAVADKVAEGSPIPEKPTEEAAPSAPEATEAPSADDEVPAVVVATAEESEAPAAEAAPTPEGDAPTPEENKE